jgi:hypothetical protein
VPNYVALIGERKTLRPDRLIDRQTDRQAGRQADRQTDRQTDRTVRLLVGYSPK